MPSVNYRSFKPIAGVPKDLIHIGNYLRLEQIKRKIQFKDLAEILNVSRFTLHHWQHGTIEISDKHIDNVIDFLGYCPLIDSATD